MSRLVISLLCLALLSACETTEGAGVPPVGASVQPIEADRFRVTYRGAGRMSEAEVEDRALYRAAQLSLSNGFDWFRVTQRSHAIAPPTGPQISIGVGGASFGHGSGIGVGGATTFGGEGSFVVSLEIVGGRGGARPDSPDVYDARAVSNTLGQRFQ